MFLWVSPRLTMRPPHLRAHPMPRLSGSSDFNHQQQAALSHLLTVFIQTHLGDFLMLLFLFDSVLFMSSPAGGGRGGGRAISPSSAPSVPVTSPGWQQHSSFWNTFTAGENPSEWEEKRQKTHLSREESPRGCQRGGGVTRERWTKIETHQGAK